MKLNLKGYKPSKKILLQSGMILMGTFMLVLILEIRERCSEEEITYIERNEYDAGIKKEELELEIEGEKVQTVTLEISPRSFTEEEIEKLFSEVSSSLEKIMLDKNESLDFVTENLELPTSIESYPFSISWRFSRYDIIDINGNIRQEKLVEIDPEKLGVPVTVTAFLSYEMKEFIWNRDLIIYPQEERKLTISEAVLESVSKINNESKEEVYIVLPSTVNGKKIVWKREQNSDKALLLILGIVLSVLLVCLERQKIAENEKKKREQMLFDYSEIISQFIILMGAGMTAKNAWKKMVEDYQKQKRHSGRIRWAYEEMEIALKEMQNGVPEVECYENFAKRCDLVPYIKLGALLAQNLKKGTKGLWIQMEMEAHQAMNDRKNQIKRLGEEAGTKLLLPMLLMLVVVLMIVIVPAFLSIQL